MNNSIQRRNFAALIVTILGCAAMAGDIMGSLVVKGLGAASAFAPFPKVFCDNQGLEGFASDFTIVAQGPEGETRRALTPEMYARLEGPYNRRNVYGAALSFGMKLPDEMWRPVFAYALGPNGSLRREFGLPDNATNLAIIVRTKTRDRSDQWVLQNP